MNTLMLICISDIDECASHPCHNEGMCYDAMNHYSCTCKDGYTHANCQIGIYNSNIAVIDIVYTCKTPADAVGNPKANCKRVYKMGDI